MNLAATKRYNRTPTIQNENYQQVEEKKQILYTF